MTNDTWHYHMGQVTNVAPSRCHTATPKKQKSQECQNSVRDKCPLDMVYPYWSTTSTPKISVFAQ
jgi:hypothetical protein